MLLFDTFTNDETHSFIGFSTVSNIELLLVSVPVLIILLFLANGINDKIKSSDTPDQKGLSLMEFLAANQTKGEQFNREFWELIKK